MLLDNRECEEEDGDEEGKGAIVGVPSVQLAWHPLDTRQLEHVSNLENVRIKPAILLVCDPTVAVNVLMYCTKSKVCDLTLQRCNNPDPKNIEYYRFASRIGHPERMHSCSSKRAARAERLVAQTRWMAVLPGTEGQT